MPQAAIFKANRNQVIRLPKAVEFPEGVERVDIIVLGNARVITPAGQSWESWFDGPAVSDDFMNDRDQPAI